MGSTPTPGTALTKVVSQTQRKRKQKMRDTTYATVTRWTEYRPPSGRWSTVPSPDGSERTVYKFAYYSGPREITKYESENNDVA